MAKYKVCIRREEISFANVEVEIHDSLVNNDVLWEEAVDRRADDAEWGDRHVAEYRIHEWERISDGPLES